MLRHLSTGSETLAALMAAGREREPAGAPDIRRWLAELGDHATSIRVGTVPRPDAPAAE